MVETNDIILTEFMLSVDGEIVNVIEHPTDWWFNPSLTYTKRGKKLMSWRVVETQIDNWNKDYYKSEVYLGYLTNNYKIKKYWKVQIKGLTEPNDRGVEDIRLFTRPDGIYFIGVLPTYKSDTITLATRLGLFKLSNDLKTAQFIQRFDPRNTNNGQEKNWQAPNVYSDLFDYNYSPTQVVKDNKIIGEENSTLNKWHGGPSLLLQEDGNYLGLIHQLTTNEIVIGDKKRQRYYRKPRLRKKYNLTKLSVLNYQHMVALYDENGLLKKTSNSFRFTEKPMGSPNRFKNVEFCSAMLEDGDKLIIGIGYQDKKIILFTVNKEKLKETINGIS